MVRTSARPYAGPGSRVLRVAELGRRMPVAAFGPEAEPFDEAPTTTAVTAPVPATTAPVAPSPTPANDTSTTQARATTTTEAPTPVNEPKTVAPAPPASSSSDSEAEGGATWYHAPDGTCAHRSLPFGTVVTVTSLSAGTSTTCTVADRGPFVAGMIIDLSMDTFANLAGPGTGIIQVRLSW